MTWALEFRMQVHANCSAFSTEDVNLVFLAATTFLPFEGLVIKFNDDLWLKIEKPHWFCDDGKFVSFSEDKRFYNSSMRSGYSPADKQAMWDHVQEEYLAKGWLIKSGGMLWPRCPEHGTGMEPGGTPVEGDQIPQWWCRSRGNLNHFVSEARLDLGYVRRTEFDD